MIELRRSEDRGRFENEWLESRFSFSFADYYDPRHVAFGPLRVLNDDWVRPGRGFDPHPHREMEIITYVLQGAVEHQDSSGGRGIVGAGEVQVMSAGTGVVHSERNPSPTEDLHLLQIWVMPAVPRLPPRYEQRKFTVEGRRNRLLPVVAQQPVDGALKIFQDVTMRVAALDAGRDVELPLGAGRRAYVHVIEGRVSVNAAEELRPGDAAKLTAEDRVALRALEAADLVLFDLP